MESLISAGDLPVAAREVGIEVEPPKQADHGDFATNFCLVAAKTAGLNPRALAEKLVPAIQAVNSPLLNPGEGEGTPVLGAPVLSGIEIAGPGFVNFRLNPAWAAGFLDHVIKDQDGFYKLQPARPLKINVEHVSVNPNGPITIGSGRGAAFGSALCNVLEAAGHTVHREYYINDGVNSEQMRLFAESVKAIIEGRPVPDNGYKGDYVHEVARLLSDCDEVMNLSASIHWLLSDSIPDTHTGDTPKHPHNIELLTATLAGNRELWRRRRERLASFSFELSKAGTEKLFCTLPISDQIELCTCAMIAAQHNALTIFQTKFNTWFSEQTIHDEGLVAEQLNHLVASCVADDEPTRTKVVFAKGGVIKEVLKEEQPADEDDPDSLLGTGEGQGGVDAETGPGAIGRAGAANKTIWLRSTKFGDDQDRVLKRKDGRLTYIASDVAYHKDKFNRPANADKLITVLGPDHHGYIARLSAVVAAMHADQAEPVSNDAPLSDHEAVIYDSREDRNRCLASLGWAEEHLEVQIFQIVRFLKDGKPAPMRKRDGNIYALIDLVDEIGETLRPNGSKQEKQQAGTDVARFFYLMRHHDTAMDFDLELATKQSDENPVFYVQYAHARICSVIDKAAAEGFVGEQSRIDQLTHPKETALILKICDLRHEVERTAADYSVNRLATYAIELARTYHGFYDSCRVIQPDQPDLTRARLALCESARAALKAALGLLGVSAPDRMDRSA